MSMHRNGPWEIQYRVFCQVNALFPVMTILVSQVFSFLPPLSSFFSSFMHTWFFPPNLPSQRSCCPYPICQTICLSIGFPVPCVFLLTSYREKSPATEQHSKVDSTRSSVDKWRQDVRELKYFPIYISFVSGNISESVP